MFRQILSSAVFLIAGALAPAMATGAEVAKPHVVGAYYPGGSVERYPVSNIPAERLTHLFYAFARIEGGKCVVAPEAAAHFEALAELKRRHPHLRTLISIGGWEAGGFSDAALTADSRRRFVDSCVAMFFDQHRGSFDGVDIDWEFPVYGGPKEITDRPQDRRNMTLLAKAFRERLDALGKQRGHAFLVTAALPVGRMQSDGAYDPAKSFELAELAEVLDFINLMTYDMGTAFSKVATFNAPLREDPADPLESGLRRWNNVEGAVKYYRDHGVPADKLVLGVPFYGRGFSVASAENDGLYRAYTAPYDAGDWRTLRATFLEDPKWRRHWHPVAQTPWLFNADDKVFVSYEDPRSIGIRARYAREQGLRGVFMWELTGDDEQHNLLNAMAQPYE